MPLVVTLKICFLFLKAKNQNRRIDVLMRSAVWTLEKRMKLRAKKNRIFKQKEKWLFRNRDRKQEMQSNKCYFLNECDFKNSY